MPDYPSPCDSCSVVTCSGKNCERWLIRYRYRQKQINAFAKRISGQIKTRTDAWVYMHPDEYRRYLTSNPCENCLCRSWCDDPCPKYLAHFKAKMDALSRAAGGRQSGTKACAAVGEGRRRAVAKDIRRITANG